MSEETTTETEDENKSIITRATDDSRIRRRNTRISYDVDVEIPVEYVEEIEESEYDGDDAEKLAKAVAKRDFEDTFGTTGTPNVGVVRSSSYPESYVFTLLVQG